MWRPQPLGTTPSRSEQDCELVGTPYNSGESERDQGISKAGNRRVRAMIVEIAWLWLRFQPKSALSQPSAKW